MQDKTQKIQEVLKRGVENIYPSDSVLEKALQSGKKLKIYNGIDPTGKLHIGHGVVLLKLKQLQALGHEIIVLVGGFTAQIGDPTDKAATRQPLTASEVKKNAKDYKKLIGKILDTKKVKFMDNAKWTNKLSPQQMMSLASNFTVSRLLERDMFQARLKEGKEIHLHEFLYPVFQANDSVEMNVDMEVGGNDQTFNMLAGRTLMKKLKNKEKFVLTTKLLTDPTGKKMGKSEGNMVNLDDDPSDMYGKVMSWPDTVVPTAFEIATDLPWEEVQQLQKEAKAGKNPKELKMKLASSIVALYHGEKAATAAAENFSAVFEKKEKPVEMDVISVTGTSIVDVLVETKLASSKSEARRVVAQKGVKVNDQVVESEEVEVPDGAVIQKGKRHFVKITRR